MFFNAPTLGFLLAAPAFAAVLPLFARDVLEARQGGSGPFDGEATTFTGSSKSSCGAPLAAGAIAVALNGDWQTGISPNLAACGKQITITNNGNGLQGSIIQGSSKGKTITATVQDTCPECDHTHIDLTTGAWNALTDNSAVGVVGITWSFVGGAPDSSGSGSTPTTSSPAAGSGTSNTPDAASGAGTGGADQTVSKVAAKKAGSPQKFNLATLPQSGDLSSTLQQTGTGSGNNNTETGSSDSTSVTPDPKTVTGTTSGTLASGSGTPSSGGTSNPVGQSVTGSGASGGTAGKFFQCGGSAWSGPTSCESGTTCQVQNQYYSQCL